MDSILDSVKKMLGVPVEQTDFDPELVMYINAALSTLSQLGVGPVGGFAILDSTAVWDDFLGTNSIRYNDTKSYIFMSVKMLFDPPATSFLLAAYQEMIKEAAWRINITRESTDWVSPLPVEVTVLDGGNALTTTTANCDGGSA